MSVPALRLVLDTNVVLDLLHFGEPSVQPIRDALERHHARCYASQGTLFELGRVLTYPVFRLDASAQAALLARYHLWVGEPQTATANPNLPRCSDPDDQIFLELAASIQADFLVSKDKAVLALRRRVPGFKIGMPHEVAAFLALPQEGSIRLASS